MRPGYDRDLATQFLVDAKHLLESSHAILVNNNGRHPKYFVDFHKKTKRPIFTYDPRLAKPFNPTDGFMLDAWIKTLRELHGHHCTHVIHRRTLQMKTKGFSLLELMIVLLVMTTVLCIALPNAVQIAAAMNQGSARKQIGQVRDVEVALALCGSSPSPAPSCGALAPLVPQPGGLITRGYLYTFDPVAWSYQAAPVSGSGLSYWVDATGILRCEPALATASSPVCN